MINAILRKMSLSGVRFWVEKKRKKCVAMPKNGKYCAKPKPRRKYSRVTLKRVIAFNTPSWFDWANQNKPRKTTFNRVKRSRPAQRAFDCNGGNLANFVNVTDPIVFLVTV